MDKVGMSSPWIKFYHEVDALFKEDPEVRVLFDEGNYTIKLYVGNLDKAEALTQLLPAEKTYGNITMKITVLPANKLGESKLGLFQKAFEGNPALSYVRSVNGLFNCNYVVFAHKVVQFFNDDMSDVNGNCTTLYQEIAKDVFGDVPGISFCTDIEKE